MTNKSWNANAQNKKAKHAKSVRNYCVIVVVYTQHLDSFVSSTTCFIAVVAAVLRFFAHGRSIFVLSIIWPIQTHFMFDPDPLMFDPDSLMFDPDSLMLRRKNRSVVYDQIRAQEESDW